MFCQEISFNLHHLCFVKKPHRVWIACAFTSLIACLLSGHNSRWSSHIDTNSRNCIFTIKLSNFFSLISKVMFFFPRIVLIWKTIWFALHGDPTFPIILEWKVCVSVGEQGLIRLNMMHCILFQEQHRTAASFKKRKWSFLLYTLLMVIRKK